MIPAFSLSLRISGTAQLGEGQFGAGWPGIDLLVRLEAAKVILSSFPSLALPA